MDHKWHSSRFEFVESIATFLIHGLLYSDSTFQPVYSDLASCAISTMFNRIVVTCSYPNDSIATGFEVIALLMNSDKVYAAHQTTDCQTEASVLVEEFGLYLVAIFPTRRETGIVDLPVEYTKLINVASSRGSPKITDNFMTNAPFTFAYDTSGKLCMSLPFTL